MKICIYFISSYPTVSILYTDFTEKHGCFYESLQKIVLVNRRLNTAESQRTRRFSHFTGEKLCELRVSAVKVASELCSIYP